MRGATLGVAVALLAVACGMVPPLGGRQIAARVTNISAVPVELGIKTSEGFVQGAVQPASLPPGATRTVTFFVPEEDDYWIMVNTTDMFDGRDIDETCRDFRMEVNPDGSGSIGCTP